MKRQDRNLDVTRASFDAALSCIREAFNALLEEQPQHGAGSQPAARDHDLVQRLEVLQCENRNLRQQLDDVAPAASGDDMLASLYVAGFSLHRSRSLERVLEALKEILINLIGAERFQIYVLDDAQRTLMLLGTESNDAPARRSQQLSDGILSVVAKTGIPFIDAERREGDFRNPVACVPMNVDGRTLGVIHVEQLFVQKASLTPGDQEMFGLLVEHAGPAVLSALLWRRFQGGATAGWMADLLPTIPPIDDYRRPMEQDN